MSADLLQITVIDESRLPANGSIDRDGLVDALNAWIETTDTEARIEPPRKKFGTVGSLDPSVIDLLIQVASSSAAASVVTGLYNLVLARVQRSKSVIKLKVGDVSVEVDDKMSPEKLREFIEAIKKKKK